MDRAGVTIFIVNYILQLILGWFKTRTQSFQYRRDFGTFRDFIKHYWGLKVIPYMGPSFNIEDQTGQYGTIWDQNGPYGTVGDHRGPNNRTIEDQKWLYITSLLKNSDGVTDTVSSWEALASKNIKNKHIYISFHTSFPTLHNFDFKQDWSRKCSAWKYLYCSCLKDKCCLDK